jgi:hypothetical protein
MHEIWNNANHQLKIACSFINDILQKYVESLKYTKMNTHYTSTVYTVNYVILW